MSSLQVLKKAGNVVGFPPKGTTMRRLILAAILGTVIAATGASAAEVPAHIGRHVTTTGDTREIERVVEDFKTGIKMRDTRLLASLLVSADIPFVAPASPKGIKFLRDKYDPNASGLRAGGFYDFSQSIETATVPVEEKFYNVKITQDGHVAWVMFDYEFLKDNKVSHYGIETWQMMKSAEGKWKIASVWWTYNYPAP
jgi:hypothetical protein